MQNIGPTASNLYRRKNHDNNLCPKCEQTEDYLHIVRCQGPGTKELFHCDLDDIQEWRDAIKMLIRAA